MIRRLGLKSNGFEARVIYDGTNECVRQHAIRCKDIDLEDAITSFGPESNATLDSRARA